MDDTGESSLGASLLFLSGVSPVLFAQELVDCCDELGVRSSADLAMMSTEHTLTHEIKRMPSVACGVCKMDVIDSHKAGARRWYKLSELVLLRL